MATQRSTRAAATNRPAFTALVTGILAVLVLAILLIRDHGDASRIVHAGPPWTSSATAPSSLTVRPADQAYDGQFFYRLGVAPFSTAKEVAGVTFDLPALRNARWLSGGLAWVASGGQREAVPWALLAINLVSAIGLGAAAGALAKSSGRHAGWGLLLALYPGYAFTLTLDTSELLAGALVLAGIYTGRCRRWPLAAVLFVLAVLARDTTVAIPAGIALGGLIQLLRRRADALGPLLAGATGVVAFAAWQVLQRVRFHAWPFVQSRKNNLSGPFAGLAKELGNDLPPHGGAAAFRLVSLVILLAVIVVAGLVMRETTIPFAERVAWVPAVVVVITLNAFLWSGATAFMRAGSEAYLMSALVILGARPRYATLVAPPVAGLWLLTVGSQFSKA
ncbi:MAG: hypothetical protein JWN96_2197 [Mycobacterium sp.]|nr:hypothetical protein [Mycobacterium sp.]